MRAVQVLPETVIWKLVPAASDIWVLRYRTHGDSRVLPLPESLSLL